MATYSTTIVGLLIVLSGTTAAYAQETTRAWVDVNYLTAVPSQDAQSYSSSTELPGYSLVIFQDLPEMPRANGFDIGGGYTLWSGLSVGVRLAHVRSDYRVGVEALLLEPISPGVARAVRDTDEVGSVRRTDTALDVLATYTLPLPAPALTVRVFAGPSYFTVDQAMARSVEYAATYGVVPTVGPLPILTSVDITSVMTNDAEGSGWGYNLGADVAFFFTRRVGIGIGLRHSHGTVRATLPVDVQEPGRMGRTTEADLDTGQFSLAVGARLRF